MTLIIAEAGVNHNGQKDLALELIKEAHDAGADIVKFQTFKANNLVSNNAKQAEYQKKNTNTKESQLQMLKKLELSYEDHFDLLEYSNSLGIEFLSTAFDSESLKFLVHEMRLKRLKIPSGEVTNAPFALEHARSNLKLIVSSGLTTLQEIESLLGVLAFGYTSSKKSQPSGSSFRDAYSSLAGQEALRENVTLLHCTSEYPAPFSELNLKSMSTLEDSFNLPVGLSDHSEGISASIAATALGAVVIEKHFTLSKDMQGPDHNASLNINELRELIRAIRQVEMALGDGIKSPTISELKNRDIVRKSLIARKHIGKGEIFSSDNVCIKRPGNGMSPYKYWEIIGKAASKEYLPEEILDE